MQRLVLSPLRMSRSTFEQPLGKRRSGNVAIAHIPSGAPVDGGWYTYPELAPDGLWSTPTDLGKFAIEVWHALRGESHRVLNQNSARLMVAKQLGQHGLGFEVYGEGPSFRFQHNGSNRGYRCQLLFYPERGDGVVTMTNSGAGDAVIVDVVAALRALYDWPE